MTIEVTHYYGVHNGGTKDYHLYHFRGPKRSLIIKRYGKVGTDGQMLKSDNATGQVSNDAFEKLLSERRKKGYDMRRMTQTSARFDSMTDAIKVLPMVHQRMLDNSLIASINGDSIKGQKGQFDPLAEERAKLVAEMQASAAEQEKANEMAEMAALRANPNFGMF